MHHKTKLRTLSEKPSRLSKNNKKRELQEKKSVVTLTDNDCSFMLTQPPNPLLEQQQ